jgi:hypothetical protein
MKPVYKICHHHKQTCLFLVTVWFLTMLSSSNFLIFLPYKPCFFPLRVLVSISPCGRRGAERLEEQVEGEELSRSKRTEASLLSTRMFLSPKLVETKLPLHVPADCIN